MELKPLEEAIDLLEKATASLDPDVMSIDEARGLLATYARIEKLAADGEAMLSHPIDDAPTGGEAV